MDRRRYCGLGMGTVALVSLVAFAAPALAGSGEGYFYKKHRTPIPDGHGKATLKLPAELPGDIDPTVQYVSISVRVHHPQTHDLVLRLKRPDFHFMGSPQSGIPRVVTLDDRETHGKNLGKGKCPSAKPGSVPSGFTTINDLGGPPVPMMPAPLPLFSGGIPPYAGVYAPVDHLNQFNGYHAPGSNEAHQKESWTLTAKDKKKGHAGEILCADLYLYRT